MALNIRIPKSIYAAIRLPEKQKKKILLTELAFTLYEKNILTFGKARELAQMTKWEFHEELGKMKIERHYNSECFEEDLNYGKE